MNWLRRNDAFQLHRSFSPVSKGLASAGNLFLYFKIEFLTKYRNLPYEMSVCPTFTLMIFVCWRKRSSPIKKLRCLRIYLTAVIQHITHSKRYLCVKIWYHLACKKCISKLHYFGFQKIQRLVRALCFTGSNVGICYLEVMRLVQGIWTRGPPMCFVWPMNIVSSIVSVCMLKKC
jgi:hypothetical protein